MSKQPKWLNKSEEPKTTRSRSFKQESKIANLLNGRTTINSGATFRQNDVINDFCEIEAKTTAKESFSIKVADIEKMVYKCNTAKIPIMVIDFEVLKKSYALLPFADLQMLIEMAEKNTKK